MKSFHIFTYTSNQSIYHGTLIIIAKLTFQLDISMFREMLYDNVVSLYITK